MLRRLPALVLRECLGVLLILNGPVNAFAIGLASLGAPCACAAGEPGSPAQHSTKCCGECCKHVRASRGETAPNDDSSKIRPRCPLCPSCPCCPNDCRGSCPCKAPCALPLSFAAPDATTVVWHLFLDDVSFSDSHPEEPLLPPRV